MLVIHYNPRGGVHIPHNEVDSFVKDTVNLYRKLPRSDNNTPPIHCIDVSTTNVVGAFVNAINEKTIDIGEIQMLMNCRQVYFLFLKNLFSENQPVTHEALTFIFQNPNSSFAAL